MTASKPAVDQRLTPTVDEDLREFETPVKEPLASQPPSCADSRSGSATRSGQSPLVQERLKQAAAHTADALRENHAAHQRSAIALPPRERTSPASSAIRKSRSLRPDLIERVVGSVAQSDVRRRPRCRRDPASSSVSKSGSGAAGRRPRRRPRASRRSTAAPARLLPARRLMVEKRQRTVAAERRKPQRQPRKLDGHRD